MNSKTLMVSCALLAAVCAVAGQALAADAPKPAQAISRAGAQVSSKEPAAAISEAIQTPSGSVQYPR
ncbi:hypothetical protein KI811_14625 [Geobacter hydrogenophilus]|uniref:Uncharacterized protein n=1 Tax=Geobacter hydrogenophilus TaxID=40983 RepID=A0A9W6FY58_9BACT|nr:hypothetical protein [Geobacter hydrogenophilus]MBT0895045.1 hypothetical protein [Geobacter hydrogenophilus]GLI36982.1 hypothetical protein GHYDROH2_04830 [Geobacter hydrogenophilus]